MAAPSPDSGGYERPEVSQGHAPSFPEVASAPGEASELRRTRWSAASDDAAWRELIFGDTTLSTLDSEGEWSILPVEFGAHPDHCYQHPNCIIARTESGIPQRLFFWRNQSELRVHACMTQEELMLWSPSLVAEWHDVGELRCADSGTEVYARVE